MFMVLSALELWSGDIIMYSMTSELFSVRDNVWHQAPKRVYLQTAPSPPGGGPFGVTGPLRGGEFTPGLVGTHGARCDARLQLCYSSGRGSAPRLWRCAAGSWERSLGERRALAEMLRQQLLLPPGWERVYMCVCVYAYLYMYLYIYVYGRSFGL